MASIFKWAVGLTTAPRECSTLETSLKSLFRAGWTTPRLFAEPGTRIPQSACSLPLTQRDSCLGAFPNWYLALTELAMRHPDADAWLLCQDDVLYIEGLRAYLESTLWPSPEAGVVSIYCPSHEHRPGPPEYRRINSAWNTWGALAYVFSCLGIRRFLSDATVLEHRFSGPADGKRNIDSVVGQFCHDSGLSYFVHTPSLAQHIGRTSTIWHHAAAIGRRRAVGSWF